MLEHNQGLTSYSTKLPFFSPTSYTMSTVSTAPAALVPMMPDAVNRRRLHLVTDLRPGDQLHFTATILGFPKGLSRAIYGYCVHTDEQGQAYCVKAYVQPLSTDKPATAYTDRDARRYPTASQREQWFGAVLLYLTEIDLTDYADCLRLERLSDRVLPLLVNPTDFSHVEAA